MALQPAAGARDLLPRDVEANRWIADKLAEVYRRWGYAEVMPPSTGTPSRSSPTEQAKRG
jgi:ATP phosphoribosyltransferase regulatory subunit